CSVNPCESSSRKQAASLSLRLSGRDRVSVCRRSAQERTASMLALPLPNIPEKLSALRTIALDLRWTWSHEADALWEYVDEKLWRVTRNPWSVLQNATEDRLRKLVGDSGFCRKLASFAA